MNKIISLFSIILFFNSYGQEKNSSIPNIGIGILQVNTTYPLSLYKNETDNHPIGSIKFEIDKSGITNFIMDLNLNPHSMSSGDSYKAAKREINSGLVPLATELIFIVIDSTKNHFEVIINKIANESFFIKKEEQNAYYTNLSELYENNCSNCPNSNYNPRWFVFETWERYLKRVEYIEKQNLIIYDKPNGEIIYENKGNEFLPFNITEVKGDWIKLKKGFGRESNFEKSKNYNGWTQWKNGNKILINIIEETYI